MEKTKDLLLQKIADRSAKLGIVGLGYVGLPLAVAFAEYFQVVGIDLNSEKVSLINKGESYVEDIESAELAPLVSAGKLTASTNYEALSDADAVLICVPTPLHKTKDPDTSYIVDAAEKIVVVGTDEKLIILESTTYPGTTEEVLLPILEEQGIVVGEHFFLAFSPERIDPGRKDYTFYTTPKVVGGITPNCLEVAIALYSSIVETPVPVSDTKTAEMTKLLENTFRAVNIALVNEIALICDKLDISVWEVVEAADTKPYGFMKFTPGPGLGGHCIPVDPQYLSWKLRTLNYKARFVELADEVNRSMPHHVLDKVGSALNSQERSIKNSNILIIGVAYKPNIGDVRESPALDVISLIAEKGGVVSYHDPYVPSLVEEGYDFASTPLTKKLLQSMNCVVVITNHASINWDLIVENSVLIVDTRDEIFDDSVGNHWSI